MLGRLLKNRWSMAGLFVLLGAVLGSGVTIAAYPSPPKYQKLPPCQAEDGRLDGQPCWWTDPDTGTRYYISSEEYRN
jgi:hypothetical protein